MRTLAGLFLQYTYYIHIFLGFPALGSQFNPFIQVGISSRSKSSSLASSTRNRTLWSRVPCESPSSAPGEPLLKVQVPITMRTRGFYIGNSYGLGKVLLTCGLGRSGSSKTKGRQNRTREIGWYSTLQPLVVRGILTYWCIPGPSNSNSPSLNRKIIPRTLAPQGPTL